ncbi:S9 family peptidase [Streptosporangium sp. NPDC004379]|uniref:S9 family peptidase n=1 Tax=Streptosporangium sp. NPDC004379 TaxID=3366189 RepID=UPI0036AF0FD2
MSPIPAELVARATVSYDAVQAVGETVYWIEGRPDGDVLVRWTPHDGTQDVLPEGVHVASYVHEYGGGAYLATEGDIWYCDAEDQRIYRASGGAGPVPVTPPAARPGALRYADLRLVPGSDTLVCVRERHEDDGTVHNELVALSATKPGEPVVIASGDDFYMSPEPSPDGRRLAWVSWNAPLMPWDGSQLWTADLQPNATLTDRRLVAGGEDESVCQPRWSPDGVLHLLSDRSGWWNLYAWHDGRLEPVITGEFEVAAAPWEFGYRTYGFQAGRIVAVVQEGPLHRLVMRNADGSVEPVALPYTSIKPYLAVVGELLAFIGSSPAKLPTVVLADTAGAVRELTTNDLGIDESSLVVPEPFIFPTRDGERAYGLYYSPPPSSRTNERPPPLLVRAHPGPTANWPMRLDLHAQFFVSRGFAVADIDYRGSTGYGRAYRLGLRHRWGTVDATDCADAALHLASIGRADLERMAIWGASAGGYTVLRALTTTDVFVAGTARSAVVNLTTWGDAAPKFQAHHAELLRCEEPDRSEVQVRRPLLLTHGDEDRVTPLEEVQCFMRNVGPGSCLVVISGASHTLRRSVDVCRLLGLELDHIRAC